MQTRPTLLPETMANQTAEDAQKKIRLEKLLEVERKYQEEIAIINKGATVPLLPTAYLLIGNRSKLTAGYGQMQKSINIHLSPDQAQPDKETISLRK